MREILTIQCGRQANYVGTHFWNFQEQYFLDTKTDLDHDVIYHQGISPSGVETYTPRVLIYDCACNMGSLKKINQLYEVPNDRPPPAEVVQPEAFPEHPFQTSLESVPDAQLLSDTNVRYWSDYNMQFFRPASYLPIDSTAVERPLKTWQEGTDAYSQKNREASILDEELRPFIEQCDLLQSFNILSSSNDGWSGFCSELILDLDSEFTKQSKCLIDVGIAEDRVQHLNRAQAVLAVNEMLDMHVPLATKCTWTGAASSGLWLDTITLPLRSKQSPLQMSDMTSFLSPTQKIFRATLGGEHLSTMAHGTRTSFVVSRGTPFSCQSRLVDGRLATAYDHPQAMSHPPSFPTNMDASSATLDFVPRGARSWLQQSRASIAAIAGQSGYSERKEVIESLRELEGSYANEFEEMSSCSSDDDF